MQKSSVNVYAGICKWLKRGAFLQKSIVLKIGKLLIYKNDNPLPIAYTYRGVMDEDEWEGLSPVGKEEAMLQAVLLEGYNGQIQKGRVFYTNRTLAHTIESQEGTFPDACIATNFSLNENGDIM